jgi:hypothetical protein
MTRYVPKAPGAPRKKPVALKGDRRRKFIEYFSMGLPVYQAAEAAGVTARTVFREVERDEAFREEYEMARRSMAARLEQEAVRRAFEGVIDFVRDKDGNIVFERDAKGELVMDEDPLGIDPPKPRPAVVCKHSDRLMEVLLRAHGGDRYRERPLVDVNIGVGKGGVVYLPEPCKDADEWMEKYGNSAQQRMTAAEVRERAGVVDATFSEVPANGLPKPSTPAVDPAEERRRERHGGVRLEKPPAVISRPRGARSF